MWRAGSSGWLFVGRGAAVGCGEQRLAVGSSGRPWGAAVGCGEQRLAVGTSGWLFVRQGAAVGRGEQRLAGRSSGWLFVGQGAAVGCWSGSDHPVTFQPCYLHHLPVPRALSFTSTQSVICHSLF